jgi:hypothetical protein
MTSRLPLLCRIKYHVLGLWIGRRGRHSHPTKRTQDKRAVRVGRHVVGASEKFRGQTETRVRTSLNFIKCSAPLAVRTPPFLREATHGAA